MALHFSGRDKDGTHRVSASSGHGEAISGARGIDAGYIKLNKLQPIKTKESYPAYTEVKYPISMNIDFHMGGYDFVGERTFAFSGDVEATDLSSISIYRNGLALTDYDYSIDLISKSITLFLSITPADDSLEIRAKRCNKSAELIQDVLILKVSERLPFDELSKLHPTLGETIDRLRILKYEENKDVFQNVTFPFNTLEVVSYRVEPDGIYATLKTY